MRSKWVILSVLASMSIVTLLVVAAAAFVFIGSSAVQAEEAMIEVAPLEIEPISQPAMVKPVINYERASYAGHDGGCPFGNAKMQLTQKEAPEQIVVGQDLLTLAE